jgi:DNA-binding NarL/FixJ family response regulator
MQHSGELVRRIGKVQQAIRLERGNVDFYTCLSVGAEKTAMELTNRERQIIRLVSEGLSNKQIARRLSITDGTVKVHLHHICEKLQVSNRTAIAAVNLSRGLDKLDHE